MFAERPSIITHMKQDLTEELAMIITELVVSTFFGCAQVDAQKQGDFLCVF